MPFSSSNPSVALNTTSLSFDGTTPSVRTLRYRATLRCVATLDVIAKIGMSMRSEEHTSELQSLMRISYAVFCLKKKTVDTKITSNTYISQCTHEDQT